MIDLDSVLEPCIISNSKYLYNGRPVPRVTEILSAMLHEDYLMEWSNNIGFRHWKYKDVLDKAANIGSFVHKGIEEFLKFGNVLDQNSIPKNIRLKVNCAFNSFLKWWSIISRLRYEILMQEHELICKYFGGTLDLLIRINDKIYLVDFKTSNHSSYKYFLQLSAYRYMLRTELGIEIDGCIVLMLDKNSEEFTEYILNFDNPDQLAFIKECEETFLSLVLSYYLRLRINNRYSKYMQDMEGTYHV